jgi:Mn-dependent DtxR family transcriptional regulator
MRISYKTIEINRTFKLFTMDTHELVLKTLKDSKKPLKSAEIALISKIDKKEVDKAIKKLKTDGKIESPKVCFYTAK